MRRYLGCLGLFLALIACADGRQAPIKAGELFASGFSFSDELGGFRLISVSGEGTAGKPFVIVEELFETTPAILVIRRTGGAQNPRRRFLGTEFVHVAKTILNLTKRVWTGFDLELRQDLDKPSIYGDGLSFDQIQKNDKDVASDRFAKHRRLFEPRDMIRFEQGQVDPGMQLKLAMPITDTTPVAVFYLLQEPRFLSACRRDNCLPYSAAQLINRE